jgi:hypothetical protein
MDISSINSDTTQISTQTKAMNSQSVTDQTISKVPIIRQHDRPINKESTNIEAVLKTPENANEKSLENLNSEYDFKNQILSMPSASKGSKIDTVV